MPPGMVGTYIDVVSRPEHRSVLGAGLVARVPGAILGFTTFLFVSDASDSYTTAGLVSACTVGATAVMGPVLGRYADRNGQRRVLILAALTHVVVVAMVIASVQSQLTHVLTILAAVLAGGSVAPIGSFTRARWAHMHGSTSTLKTLFAVEAVLDEMVWILGPAAAAVIATVASPAAGLAASGICGFAGSVLLANQLVSDTPGAVGAERGQRFNPIGMSRVAAILGAGVCLGVAFGVNDVSAIAITRHDGVPGFAGTILAIFSVGSVIGALIMGGLQERFPPYRLFVIASLVLAVAFAPLVAAPNTYYVMLIGLFAGASCGPYTIAANRAVESLVPRAVVTEALASANTAIVGGMAVGSWLGGVVVDAWGPRGGYAVVSAICVLPFLIAFSVGSVTLRRDPHHPGGVTPEIGTSG